MHCLQDTCVVILPQLEQGFWKRLTGWEWRREREREAKLATTPDLLPCEDLLRVEFREPPPPASAGMLGIMEERLLPSSSIPVEARLEGPYDISNPIGMKEFLVE